MTDAIGRGDYVLGADFSELEKRVAEAEALIQASGKEAEKAYAEAGKRAGMQFGDALKGTLKVAGAIATGALALATKGVIELEYVTASYRAETGATAVEAKRAGDAILGMSSRNIQPLEEIGRALTKVHTDLGLAGDEAERETQRFLRFARATKQDAAAAVIAFDDVLDAWGLTAKDSGRIMDYLVASHQKYGGSIEDNQRALATMAPQLRALNMQWEDGANLLNLFAESGLDAGSAQRALNSAITNLPKGETLDEFLVRLSKVTDDGARAELAMKVFGTRAGAGLANAIRPGVASLDEFGFAAGEVTGKTEAAAEALDSTFGAQMQLLLKRFGAALTGVGKELGPLLTGFASLASLGATLGLDTFARSFGPKLIASMKAVGRQAGDALSDGISAVWSGAGGTVIGNNIASRIENIMDPTKSTVIGNVWRRAASKAATVYLSALIFQDAIVAGIGARFGAVWGKAAGAAAGVAFKLGVVGIALVAAEESGLFEKLDKTLDDLQWPLGSKGAPDWARQFGLAKKATQRGLDEILGEFLGFGQGAQDVLGKLPGALAAALDSGALSGAATAAGAAIEIIGTKARSASLVATTAARNIIAEILGIRDALVGDAQSTADAIWDPHIAKLELAATTAEYSALRQEIASGKLTGVELRDAQLRLTNLAKELVTKQATVASFGDTTAKVAHEKAMIARILESNEYRNGNADQRAILEERLRDHHTNILSLQEDAKTGTGNINNAFSGGIRAGLVDGRKGAEAVTGAVRDELGDTTGYHGYGKGIIGALAAGIIAGKVAARTAAQQAAFAIRDVFESHSPPGPKSPLHNITDWARSMMRAYADEIAGSKSMIEAAAREAMSLAPGALGGLAVNVMGQSAAAAGVLGQGPSAPSSSSSVVENHYHYHLNVDGLVRAETPEDISLQMRRVAELGA